MWIVRLALRRPYTSVVVAMLVGILGIVTILRMPTDIFPEIDIPVISAVWVYNGMAPDELEKRVTGNFERGLTTTVNGIEHIESQTINGTGLIKVFFHPGTKLEMANAQVTAIAQTMMREECPGVRIEVVDTQNVSLCQGWMVIEAARGALAGLSLDHLLDSVKKMIPISHMIQTADTLRYLYMGGRIGKAQELLGTVLNIKPLIGIEDGVIVPLGKARSRGQAYQQMADIAANVIGKGKAKIAYVHVGAQREVEKLKDLIESKVNVVESLIGELSPALAVHTGPGMTGLCYYPVES